MKFVCEFHTGFGKAHLQLLGTCGLLLMFTITETMGMAIIAPKSACEFASSEQAKAAIQAAAFIGNKHKNTSTVVMLCSLYTYLSSDRYDLFILHLGLLLR